MKRFIAGAVCPQCRAVDRIVVEPVEAGERTAEGGGDLRRRCVNCGYSDTMLPGAAAEPRRRFTRPSSDESAASPVRILDSPPPSASPEAGRAEPESED